MDENYTMDEKMPEIKKAPNWGLQERGGVYVKHYRKPVFYERHERYYDKYKISGEALEALKDLFEKMNRLPPYDEKDDVKLLVKIKNKLSHNP